MGQPKHDLMLPDGRTMIRAVIDALTGVCTKVVVIGSRGMLPGSTGDRVIQDLRPHAGPLGGIEALLASGVDSQYLVCACDVPRIGAELLRSLVDAPAGAIAVVPRVTGRDHTEPLPARLSMAALPIVTRLLDGGHRAVWQLMRELHAMEIPISSDWSDQLMNINKPEDLGELRIGGR